jgi:hypothetical protein
VTRFNQSRDEEGADVTGTADDDHSHRDNVPVWIRTASSPRSPNKGLYGQKAPLAVSLRRCALVDAHRN